MSKSVVKNVCKWVSVVLVALAVVMLFRGSLTVADKDARKELQKSLKSAEKELKVDKDDLEDLQDSLDEMDIDINAKKLLNQAKKAIKAIKDAKIAPSEIASTGPSVVSLANELSDNDSLGYLIGSQYDDILESVEQFKGGMIALIILFYVSVVVGVVVIVLHITNNKLPGVSMAVISLIWWIIMGATSVGVNSYVYNEFDVDEKIVKITAAPVWGFILAVLAMLIWIFKDKIADAIGSGETSAVAMEAATVSGGRVCPNCGKALSEGALFCSGCGTKFEAAPVAEEPAAPAKVFCANCGTELEEGTLFCPNCGTKRE
ncbi:MAG: zinc-ribbon domain-containing protein [Lachnospiraceae bacterium]|nr:zinc-ribbon domain-containing protein [Lachnospiraceae bacterium]